MRTIDLDNNSRVIVLGEGQVGSAICRSLVRSMPSVGHHSRTDWTTPETAARSTSEALANLPLATGLLATAAPLATAPLARGSSAGDERAGRTTVVWSAGTAGMATSKARCEQNLETMKTVVSAALESIEPTRRRRLHVISSAGAYAVNSPRWPAEGKPPAPIDVPYVQLKLAEEDWSRTRTGGPDPVGVTIHRVASVYARPGDPGRSGMVAAMVRNASKGNVTPIFGNWSTIRNYVHADDVGEFVARSIRFEVEATPALHETPLTETLLADRRSYAIGELVQLVSRAIRRPVPLQMIAAENAENHTFNPSMIAEGFAARSLPTAIRQMFVDLQT